MWLTYHWPIPPLIVQPARLSHAALAIGLRNEVVLENFVHNSIHFAFSSTTCFFSTFLHSVPSIRNHLHSDQTFWSAIVCEKDSYAASVSSGVFWSFCYGIFGKFSSFTLVYGLVLILHGALLHMHRNTATQAIRSFALAIINLIAIHQTFFYLPCHLHICVHSKIIP
jgi:hypothetical protein